MKILVTGSAGFIGGALTKRLVKEGHKVVGLIHKTKPTFKDKNVQYIKGDITDKKSIEKAFDKIDVVFHCAAKVKDYGPKKIFYDVNVEGTKNLVDINEKAGIKRFIFLSHIHYEPNSFSGHYSKTKKLVEKYLIEKYKKDNFQVVIIRPGNVYGPNATICVLRVLKTIKKNQIYLIDKGKGIFLHTYIENLLDALISAMQEPKAIGKTINITDGDNNTTWSDYFNALAKFIGKKPIKKNMSKKTALFISKFMILLYYLFRIEPLMTPMAVHVFTNNKKISLDNAKNILNYKPNINYNEGLKRTGKWLGSIGYIYKK